MMISNVEYKAVKTCFRFFVWTKNPTPKIGHPTATTRVFNDFDTRQMRENMASHVVPKISQPIELEEK